VLNLFNFINNSSINLLELIILLLAILSLLIIIFYYFYFFLRLVFYKKEKKEFNQPISIIICAKNELNNLKRNLPLFLEQYYFDFEVIIVNDQSTDTTKLFLDELSKKYRNLVIVDIDDFVTHTIGKKFALTLGIKTAKHEYLLLTDADCKPNSKELGKRYGF